MPCCGWRNQAGRSQPGDWRISVGDEVKAAFKLLCVDPNTHTQPHKHMAFTQTYANTLTIHTVNRNTDKEQTDTQTYGDTHTPTERGAHSC